MTGMRAGWAGIVGTCHCVGRRPARASPHVARLRVGRFGTPGSRTPAGQAGTWPVRPRPGRGGDLRRMNSRGRINSAAARARNIGARAEHQVRATPLGPKGREVRLGGPRPRAGKGSPRLPSGPVEPGTGFRTRRPAGGRTCGREPPARLRPTRRRTRPHGNGERILDDLGMCFGHGDVELGGPASRAESDGRLPPIGLRRRIRRESMPGPLRSEPPTTMRWKLCGPAG